MKYWTVTPDGYLCDSHGSGWMVGSEERLTRFSRQGRPSHVVEFYARNPKVIFVSRSSDRTTAYARALPLSARNQVRFLEAMHYYGWCSYHEFVAAQLP